MPLPSDAVVKSHAREHRRTWIGGILIAGAVVALTLLAVRYGIRYSGLGALALTFLGSVWLSIRVLRGRWARFDRT